MLLFKFTSDLFDRPWLDFMSELKSQSFRIPDRSQVLQILLFFYFSHNSIF